MLSVGRPLPARRHLYHHLSCRVLTWQHTSIPDTARLRHLLHDWHKRTPGGPGDAGRAGCGWAQGEPVQAALNSWRLPEPSRHHRPALPPVTGAPVRQPNQLARNGRGHSRSALLFPKAPWYGVAGLCSAPPDAHLSRALGNPGSVRSPRRSPEREPRSGGTGTGSRSCQTEKRLESPALRPPVRGLPAAVLAPPAPGRVFLWRLRFYWEAAMGKFGARHQQRRPA